MIIVSDWHLSIEHNGPRARRNTLYSVSHGWMSWFTTSTAYRDIDMMVITLGSE